MLPRAFAGLLVGTAGTAAAVALADLRAVAVAQESQRRVDKIREPFVEEQDFREHYLQNRKDYEQLVGACSPDVDVSSHFPKTKHSVCAWEVFVADLWEAKTAAETDAWWEVFLPEKRLAQATQRRIEESGLHDWVALGFKHHPETGHRPMLERAFTRCKVMGRPNACANLSMAKALGVIDSTQGPTKLEAAKWDKTKAHGLRLAAAWTKYVQGSYQFVDIPLMGPIRPCGPSNRSRN